MGMRDHQLEGHFIPVTRISPTSSCGVTLRMTNRSVDVAEVETETEAVSKLLQHVRKNVRGLKTLGFSL